eukprot:816966-Rhodomonas_salina.1
MKCSPAGSVHVIKAAPSAGQATSKLTPDSVSTQAHGALKRSRASTGERARCAMPPPSVVTHRLNCTCEGRRRFTARPSARECGSSAVKLSRSPLTRVLRIMSRMLCCVRGAPSSEAKK